jgi:hypothetical protein
MKRFMKITVIIAAILVLGSVGTAFAAALKTPAEIVSELTGKTADQVTAERASGKTYGTIVKDAGKLEEFQTQMLEQKKAYLDQRVKDGTLTQERADAIYDTIVEAQSSCDGTGRASSGAGCGTGTCNAGASLGRGAGCGMGNGTGRDMGNGAGCGMGRGISK